MNASQQATLHRLAVAAAKNGHQISAPIQVPGCVLVRCSCGWRYQTQRNNALGRSARVGAAMRRHYAEVALKD